MEVTLSRAIKYRNQLKEALHRKLLPVTPTLTYSTEEELTESFGQANSIFTDALSNLIEANDAHSDLRNLIGECNQKSGVSNIMTRIEGYEASIRFLEGAIEAPYRSKGLDQALIEFKNAKAREEQDPSLFVGIVTTAVVAYTNTDKENIETTIKELRKEIEALKEERNKLNLITHVELSEKIVSALKWAAII